MFHRLAYECFTIERTTIIDNDFQLFTQIINKKIEYVTYQYFYDFHKHILRSFILKTQPHFCCMIDCDIGTLKVSVRQLLSIVLVWVNRRASILRLYLINVNSR